MDKGIIFLRRLVAEFNCCDEGFLLNHTVEDLVAIRRAWIASEFDYYPDQWTPAQVRAALRGIPPRWDDAERPIEDEEQP